MTRPPAISGRDLGQAPGDVFVAEAVEAVAADALVVEGAGEGVAVGEARGGRGGRRCRSRRPAAGPGAIAIARRIGARLFGWCSGASDWSAASRPRMAASSRTGRSKSGPPWTTRWPMALELDAAEAVEPGARRLDRRRQVEDSAASKLRSTRVAPAASVAREPRVDADAVDLAADPPPGAPSTTSKSWNFRLDEPALTTRMVSMRQRGTGGRPAEGVGIEGGDGAGGEAGADLSAREVSTIGTRAPRTMPAASAWARKVRFFASMLPASRSGTTRIWPWPATGPRDALDPRRLGVDGVVEGERAVEQAAGDLAALGHLAEGGGLDRRGDLRRHRLDGGEDRDASACPCRCRPRGRWRSGRCRAWSSRSGKMLIAASVMNSVSGWPGTSMMKTWLIRRSVRRPVAEAATSFISSSVCRLPFISSSPLPSRISATAWAAAAWLCGASTMLAAGNVDAVLGGDGADLRRRADQHRLDERLRGGVDRAAQRGLVAGMGDDRHSGGAVAGGGDEAVVLSAVSARSRPQEEASRLAAPARVRGRRARRRRRSGLGRGIAGAPSPRRRCAARRRPARRSSAGLGIRPGWRARAASSSTTSIRYCSRTSALKSARDICRLRRVGVAEPDDRGEAAFVDRAARHADPEERADQRLGEAALGHAGPELRDAPLDECFVQLAARRLARPLRATRRRCRARPAAPARHRRRGRCPRTVAPSPCARRRAPRRCASRRERLRREERVAGARDLRRPRTARPRWRSRPTRVPRPNIS